jgi:DNA-binding XRE family transcriptional regulator
VSRGHGLRSSVVAELRRRRGLSQADLAARVGIDRVSLARLEAGSTDPHLSTARALAQSLGVALSEIVDD